MLREAGSACRAGGCGLSEARCPCEQRRLHKGWLVLKPINAVRVAMAPQDKNHAALAQAAMEARAKASAAGWALASLVPPAKKGKGR